MELSRDRSSSCAFDEEALTLKRIEHPG